MWIKNTWFTHLISAVIYNCRCNLYVSFSILETGQLLLKKMKVYTLISEYQCNFFIKTKYTSQKKLIDQVEILAFSESLPIKY